MSDIKHIWACSCGAETPCEREDQELGAVWFCRDCEETFANVRPRRGGNAWIKVHSSDIAFHRLFETQDED